MARFPGDKSTGPAPVKTTNRKAAYTFIFGDHDDLKTPNVVTPGWDYICFTDDPTLRSDVWDVRLSPRIDGDLQLSHKRFAMKHMILGHHDLRGYQLSLAVVAHLDINCDFEELLEEHFRPDDDLLVLRHPERDCIYAEAEVCKALFLDDPARIDAQMKRYRAEGYPEHNGLFYAAMIGRRHKRAKVDAMTALFWDEYRRGSRRSQLCFNYAVWKSEPMGISVASFREEVMEKQRFVARPHKWRVRFVGADIKFANGDDPVPENVDASVNRDTGYVGHVDLADSYRICGWAADRRRPNTLISVRLFDDDKCIATIPANQRRPDVGDYLGDNGLHGFTIPIPPELRDGSPHTISIKFDNSETVLAV